MISWFRFLFRPKPQRVPGRTCDAARRIRMPLYFGHWRNVELFRDRLEAAMLRGEMTYKNYRRRLKVLCAYYTEESRARAYHEARQWERQQTSGKKVVSPFASTDAEGHV